MNRNYDPIRGWEEQTTSDSGFSYIGIEDFGREVRGFIKESDNLRGGFYQTPSEPYRSMLIDRFDPSHPVIVNRDNRTEGFIRQIEESGQTVSEVETPYHAKAFIDTDRNRGLVLAGNLSRSALDIGAPETLQDTNIGFFERGVFAVSNIFNLGYEGTKYQLNTGLVLDRSRTRELSRILDNIERTGASPSTENFIVGGPQGESASRIAGIIRGKAGQNIDVVAPYADNAMVANALIDAIKAGSRVRIITTNPDAVNRVTRGTPYSEKMMEVLASQGAEIYAAGNNQNILIHDKSISFEDGSRISGSHNFTNKASSRQIEISAYFQDERLSALFNQDFEKMLSLTEELTFDKDYQRRAQVYSAMYDGVISSEMASAMEEGVILPSNLGASYFYARAIYNTTMRQSGNGHMVISNDDANVATATYKLSHLIREGFLPDTIPEVYQSFDKELQTQGLGAWVNEYIGIPSGWGRIYKDELGFIPSVMAAVGASIDKSYLFYAGDQDVLGLNTIYQPLTTKSAFYQDQSFTGSGLFEHVLGSGGAFAITTTSSVALYLSVGEPISLLMSEGIRSNIEETINMSIPKGEENLSFFGRLNRQASRQFTLGAGSAYLNPFSLRRDLIFSTYDYTDGRAYRKSTEFYDVDNFNISYYHVNSIMRRRGSLLLNDLVKPFLMDVINPYKTDYEDVFGSKVDDFITEVGTFIDLKFNFGDSGDEVVSNLFRVREVAEDFHRNAYQEAEKAVQDYQDLKKQVRNIDPKDTTRVAGEAAEVWLGKNRTLDPVLGYLLSDPGVAEPITFDNKAFIREGVSLGQYRERHQQELIGLSNSLLHTSVEVVNAGESRQMELARKLQGILDEVPLNPRHWRIFNNESTLKSRSIVKDWKVLGDILSFEDFTETMRNLVMGEGGITSVLDRYEVSSNLGKEGVKTAGKNAIDRLHTFWNLAINAPQDALKYLRKRKSVISKLEKSSSLYKSMEYSLAVNVENGKSVPGISWANSTTSEGFRNNVNALIASEDFKKEMLMEARAEAALANDMSPDNVQRIMDKKVKVRARERALLDLDPYSRNIDILDERYLLAMSSIQSNAASLVDDTDTAVKVTAMIADHHREQSLGILSLTSDRTFTRRLSKLKPGLGMDPTSKITKNKFMTYAFAGIALATATESLFRSSQGVSLFTTLAASLKAGSDDESMAFNFSAGGPLGPISGTLPRLAWAAGTTAATGYIAWNIAGALRNVSPIVNRVDETALVAFMNDNPESYLRHVSEEGVETTARTVNDLTQFHQKSMMGGYYEFGGTLKGGASINVRMFREATEKANRLILKKSMNFVEGRSVATAAIAFTTMSTSVMAAKAGTAWSLNRMREQDKGLAPIILPAAGAVGGYTLAKAAKSNLGFAMGVSGAAIGVITALVAPSSILNNMFSLGRGKNEVDPVNHLVSAELSSFISTVKDRIETNRASKIELMAGVYAQTYSSMLGIMAGDNDKRTHVVARQSPLPFLQFFYAATTENQYRDEQGNITQKGQTVINTGLQTAPILGGSFSVGMPFKITPGNGLFGLTYSDQNNLIDLMTGVQTAALTLTTVGLATKIFSNTVKGTLAKIGLKNELHNEHYIDTLLKISDRFEAAGRKLIVETPANIASSMFKSDMDLASKLLKSSNTIQSYSVPSHVKGNFPVQVKANKFGRYIASAFIGGYVGGTLGTILGSEDPETMESYSQIGVIAGIAGAPSARFAINAIIENEDVLPTRIKAIYRRPQINPLPHPKDPSRLTLLKRYRGISASIAIASTAAFFMTDRNFGVAENMDGHDLTRLGIVALYGAAVGTTAHHFSNSFMDASDTFRRWKQLEEIKETLDYTGGSFLHKNIAKVRGYHIGVLQGGLEQDIDHMINSIKRNRAQIETFKKYKDIDTLTPLIEASDQIQLAIKDNPGTESVTRRLLTNLGSNEIDELGQKVVKGRAQIVGRVDSVLAGKRFYRGTKSLVGFTFLFSLVAGQMGGGSIEKGLQSIHGDGGILDWGDKQGGFLHGISNVIGSTLKLATFMDASPHTPTQYGKYLNTYIDRTEQGGRKGAIRSSINLVKSRNNPMSAVSDLFSATEDMFILNSSNAFIQLIGPVGFTFRSGEYGKRINSYVQIQGPGADISTASYSMAAAYSFRQALSGSADAAFNMQSAVRHLNQALNTGQGIDERAIRRAALSITTLTSKQEPLKKKRRYSSHSRDTLSAISSDPLLTHSLRYRKQVMENMASQSYASLGTRLLMEQSTNHVLSDVGLLKALFSKDPSALRTLLEDPFGLLTKNVVISEWTLFSPSNKRNQLKVTETGSGEYWAESRSIQSTVNRDGYPIPGLGFLANVFSSLWGSNDGPLNMVKAGVFVLGSSLAILSASHAIGSMGLNLENSQILDDLDKFYQSKLFDVSINKGYINAPIQASFTKTIGGQTVTGPGGAPRIEVTKGSNIFSINQSFSSENNFVRRLNKGLLEYQRKMNDLHLKFFSEDGTDLSFGQYMRNRILNSAESISDEIDDLAAKQSGVKPRDILSKHLKDAYGQMVEDYTKGYLNALAETFVETPFEGKSARVSLLTLLGSETASGEYLVEISHLLETRDITPIEALQRLADGGGDVSPYVNQNFFDIHRKNTTEVVETIIEEVVNKSWRTYDSMLSQGRIMQYTGTELGDGVDRHLVGALDYINQRVAYALSQASRDTPISSIKNYFGRIPKQPTIDLVRREASRLGAILRSSAGLDLSFEGYELLSSMPSVATSTQMVNLANDSKPLTGADIAFIQKRLSKEHITGSEVFIPGPGTSKGYKVTKSTAQKILDLSSTLDDYQPSSMAMKRARAMYKGTKPVRHGFMTAFEFGTFAFDLFEAVDTYGAYSRLASSYTSGTYTEAQRKSLAQETGGITTNALLAAGFGGAMMNIGALATTIGGTAATALGGTAVGVAGIGAGVLGGAILIGAGLLLGAGYLMMPKSWRKKVNSSLGSAHTYVSDKIGSGLLALGDMGKRMMGPRGASSIIGAVGGLLSGFIVGMGLVSLAAFSGPVLATLGIAAGVGAGLGIIGGLIAPNQLGNLSRTISTFMSTIPFVGGFFNAEGKWLAMTGEHIEGSPFFTGTANQAIQLEFERHMEAAADGSAMSQMMVDRSVYGGVVGDPNYITKKSGNLIGRITPGSLVDPTLDRELKARATLYSHSIISRYIWNSIVSNSSNKRVIREAEIKYRAQQYKEIEEMEREAKRVTTAPDSIRRNSQGDLVVAKVLVSNIVEVSREIEASAQDNKQILNVKVGRGSLPSSSSAVSIRDLKIDRASVEDIKNDVSSTDGGNIKIKQEVDEERDFARSINLNNSIKV